MCGLAGCVLEYDGAPILLDMLRRVEYRGYDSAGVGFLDNGMIRTRKAAGPLSNLAASLSSVPIQGYTGIGHTRWATHGIPSERNAHPQVSPSGNVAVVHNGIIENYLAIYDKLYSNGYTTSSDTDSESVAHLIEHHLASKPDASARDIVNLVTREVRGAYALLILIVSRPGELIGIRQFCPLNFVKSSEGIYLSSDISSLVSYSKEIQVLQDGQAIWANSREIDVFDYEGLEGTPIQITVDWTVEDANKSGYSHFLRKEIDEESDALKNLETLIASTHGACTDFFDRGKFSRIVYLACGSASYSCHFASTLTRWLDLPIDAISEIGSEFRYNMPQIGEDTLIVTVSQSGETADTLGSVVHAKKYGAKILSFVNVAGSGLERESDLVCRLGAGSEIAVPSSKAVINQFAAMAYVVQCLSSSRRLDLGEWRAGMRSLIEAVQKILGREQEIKEIARSIAGHESSFALGRGVDYPIAMEMALKQKECAYLHSEAIQAGEFKHGSISLIEYGMPVLCFISDSKVVDKTISNMMEVKARGAELFGTAPISGCRNQIERLGNIFFYDDIGAPWNSISQLTFAHLLAFHCGILRRVAVDRPRNLAKSVTVE